MSPRVEHPLMQGAALAVATGVSAALCGLLPSVAPPVPELQPWLSFVSLAWWAMRADRCWQNWRLWTRWHTLPLWESTPEALVQQSSTDAFMLGKGFAWHPDNTRALLAWLDRYGLFPTTDDARGGTPALHAVGSGKESPVVLPASELGAHLAIQAATRGGKTELLRVLLSNAIRQTSGAIVVIDPKGGGDLVAHAMVEAHKAKRPFALISPLFPASSRPFDPLSTCSTPIEVKERVRSLMPQDTRSSPFFTNHPLAYLQRAAAMMQRVGDRWTLPALREYTLLAESRRRIAARFLITLGASPTLDTRPAPSLHQLQAAYDALPCEDSLAKDVMNDLVGRDHWIKETTSSLDAALSGIIDTEYTHLFTDQPALTWQEIDQQHMVVVVCTASLLLREAGNKIGRLLLQDLLGSLGRRYLLSSASRHDPITILVDETSDVFYDDLLQQVSKGGEAGARFIFAWQSQADPEDKLGRARARVLLDNLQTRIWLRIADSQTTQEVSEGLGTCTIVKMGDIRGLSYGKNGTQANNNRRLDTDTAPLIAPEWFPKLPQGEGFARIRGALYKFRVPLLPKPDDEIVARMGYSQVIRTLRQAPEEIS